MFIFALSKVSRELEDERVAVDWPIRQFGFRGEMMAKEVEDWL